MSVTDPECVKTRDLQMQWKNKYNSGDEYH